MLSRLCGQVSEAVEIAKGFGSKTATNYFGLGVEHSSGNGDEWMNLRKPLMAVVSRIGHTFDEGGKIEG